MKRNLLLIKVFRKAAPIAKLSKTLKTTLTHRILRAIPKVRTMKAQETRTLI
jgi:hypothetical protein